MSAVVITKTFTAPPWNEKEILRYAGCKTADSEIQSLLCVCRAEAEPILQYRVCYTVLPTTVTDSLCSLGPLRIQSAALARQLCGCDQTVIFAATVGLALDRLIAKYSRISPAKALMMQAIGAERVEALCNTFCAQITDEQQRKLRPRFSPGYGDLPLETQKELFAVLECAKRIGVSLTDSLLMMPTKSVTAIVGIPTGIEQK